MAKRNIFALGENAALVTTKPRDDREQGVPSTETRHQSPREWFWDALAAVWRRRTLVVAAFSVAAIVVHLVLRFGLDMSAHISDILLPATFVFCGVPLVWELLVKLWRREFGSDLLSEISIVTSV